MNNVQKIMIAVVAVFAIGFIMVGSNKEKSTEEREAESMIRTVASMQGMANQKCPAKIKQITGSQVYFPSDTDSDKATFVSMTWEGEKGDNFKTATCVLHAALGGISRLTIDGKVIINKDI